MNKYFIETITQKALEVKLSLVDDQQTTQAEAEFPKGYFKNVCTPIPQPMNKELERISGLLGIPKNRFLYLALSSALDEAQELLKQIDVSEYVREFNQTVKTQEVA